jgi:hypothetical protein
MCITVVRACITMMRFCKSPAKSTGCGGIILHHSAPLWCADLFIELLKRRCQEQAAMPFPGVVQCCVPPLLGG